MRGFHAEPWSRYRDPGPVVRGTVVTGSSLSARAECSCRLQLPNADVEVFCGRQHAPQVRNCEWICRVSAHQERPSPQRPRGPAWRRQLYEVIFEAETPSGRFFDLALLVIILTSILVIALETVPSINSNERQMQLLRGAELFFTILFGIEYVGRLLCTRKPLRYAFSFWGLIDLVSFLPSLVTGLAWDPQPGSFVIVRSVRLLRVFRILKLWRMMNEADELSRAIWQAREKIIVFLTVVMVAVTISGTLMYHVEHLHAGSGFSSIPQSMYWAIVTMTTVGYGDIVPETTAGKLISAVLILLGYSLIIVPSAFVSAELTARRQEQMVGSERTCDNCGKSWHAAKANFCDRCAAPLPANDL
jgi:voltage-gated potassium channel